MYQIRVRQYRGSIPVMEEVWRPAELEEMGEGEQTAELAYRMKTLPLQIRLTCAREEKQRGNGSAGEKRRFRVEAEALEDLEAPVSAALERTEEAWRRENYVFFPAAVYDGNRMESRYLPYPPYCAEKRGDRWIPVITDIPRLSTENAHSRIQFLSGDMSTPACGYYSREKKTGVLLLAKHKENGRYTGFTAEEDADRAVFSISSPGVREKNVYFFGELPDGSGFYPTCGYPSADEGALLKKGEILTLDAECHVFAAGDMEEYFRIFHEVREDLEQGEEFCSIPFSRAYREVKEKFIRMNFDPEGYLRVGTGETIPACWQAGWVGGGMNTWPLLTEDHGTAREQALSTLHFITEKLQRENGWYVPMYADGQCYGDAFLDTSRPVLLVRKDADLLYFMAKQAMYLREEKKPDNAELSGALEESIARQADAFVRFFEKHGQLGQFIDMESEEILAGGTGSAAIAPAALALTYEYFRGGDAGVSRKEEKYLETAEKLGEYYLERHLRRGVLNGGPGEICQAPDSESAFGLLESFVQLAETTGKEKWIRAAEEAFELAATWVVSYDFDFPKESTAAKLGAHTRGTVFANAQNKHSAPGICTLSGNSLLKLYRLTGEKRYLRWMSRISHALSQFVSLPDRPVDTLEHRPLPAGFFNERVQMSDWEGGHTVGEFLYGSNWPETTMLLTYVEIPGIYVDFDRGTVQCSDHVKAEIIGRVPQTGNVPQSGNAPQARNVPQPGNAPQPGNVLHPDSASQAEDAAVVLCITNPTAYEARVTVLADRSRDGKPLGHGYFGRMKVVTVRPGEEVTAEIAAETVAAEKTAAETAAAETAAEKTETAEI